MNDEELIEKQEIQAWIDDRFGPGNTFNIRLLLDFKEFIASIIRTEVIKEMGGHNVIDTFGKKGYDNLGLLLTAEYWQAQMRGGK